MVKTTTVDIWYSLRINLFKQQMHAISPFTVKDGKAISVWYWTLFSYLVIFVYISLMSGSIFVMYQTEFLHKIFSNSYLIAIICSFEIIFSNCNYILLITFTILTKNKQMEFLNQLHEMDNILFKHFPNTFIDYCYQRKLSWIVIVITWIYYYMLGATIWLKLYQNNDLTIENGIFVICYGYEQVTSASLAACYINYVLQLKIRFSTIKNIKMQSFSKRIIDQNDDEKKFIKNVSKLLRSFKTLTEFIQFININSGLIMILRYTHDFTLTTSQFYIIFWIIIDNHGNDKMEFICYVIYWMLQNIIKCIGIGLVTQLTANEVMRFYIYIYSYFKHFDSFDDN